jgi:hypothetical protein
MKNIVIVDIDGTISKVGDRLKYLQQEPKDWDSFYESCFEDEPIHDMLNLVNTLMLECYDVYFCTGRRESVRDKTHDWFNIQTSLEFRISPHKLLMRPDNDHRHDTEVKPELLEKAGIKLEDIVFILEDRNSMVKKWRELGVKCLQVAEGDF